MSWPIWAGALGQLEAAVIQVAVSERGRGARGVPEVLDRLDASPDRRLAESGRYRKGVFQKGDGFAVFPELADVSIVPDAPERGDGLSNFDPGAVAAQ